MLQERGASAQFAQKRGSWAAVTLEMTLLSAASESEILCLYLHNFNFNTSNTSLFKK